MHARRASPFLKADADALLRAGYQDIGWREVSSEVLGLPNPKHHIILVATASPTALVDCCLFSTVCPRRGRVHVGASAHTTDQLTTHAGTGALWRLPGSLLPVPRVWNSRRRGCRARVELRRDIWTRGSLAPALPHHQQPVLHGNNAARKWVNLEVTYPGCGARAGHSGMVHLRVRSCIGSGQPRPASERQISLCWERSAGHGTLTLRPRCKHLVKRFQMFCES
jgi:hypothetical protein